MARQLSSVEFLKRARSYLPIGIPPEAIADIECDPTDGENGGPSYWVYLRTGYRAEGGYGCHTIHEDTLKEVKSAMRDIVTVQDDYDGYD